MPPTTCDPCCDPQSLGRHPLTYRVSVLQVLCDILTALGGSTGGEGAGATFLPQSSVAFGDVPGTYEPVGFLDSEFRLRKLFVDNGTNGDIDLSFDGGNTTNSTIPAGESKEFDFGIVPFQGTQDLFFRSLDTVTSGAVTFEGYY